MASDVRFTIKDSTMSVTIPLSTPDGWTIKSAPCDATRELSILYPNIRCFKEAIMPFTKFTYNKSPKKYSLIKKNHLISFENMKNKCRKTESGISVGRRKYGRVG